MGASRRTIGSTLAPARYVMFVLLLPVFALAYQSARPAADWLESVAMGFDGAAALFLLSLIPLLRGSSVEKIRRQARENDANRLLVLIITTLISLAVMVAMTGELGGAGRGEPGPIVRLVATLALVWLFANSVYALHYAHMFYTDHGGSDRGGLDVPGTAAPSYPDFIYFAFTLGMTFQTSDITITRRDMRIVVTLHSMAAFLFNIGIIAFTINVIGGG